MSNGAQEATPNVGGTGSDDDGEIAAKQDDQNNWEPKEMRKLLDEAKVLNEYLARHGGALVNEEDKATDNGEPKKADGSAKLCPPLFPGHSDLIEAIAEASVEASAKNWQGLFKAYSRVSGALYQERGVSGKSILDTLNGRQGAIWKKKNIPILLGIGFFVIALIFEYLKAWVGGISDPENELTGIAGFIYEATRSLVPFVVPALWGAIGACTFLAKRISDKLFEMSYEVNRMQGIAARIFLGAILGLVIDILLFGTGGTVDSLAVGELKMGTIVAAFTVGLSVKPIYQAFETLSEGIAKRFSPAKEETQR